MTIDMLRKIDLSIEIVLKLRTAIFEHTPAYTDFIVNPSEFDEMYKEYGLTNPIPKYSHNPEDFLILLEHLNRLGFQVTMKSNPAPFVQLSIKDDVVSAEGITLTEALARATVEAIQKKIIPILKF